MHVSRVSKSVVTAAVFAAGLTFAASTSNVGASGDDEVTLVVWDGETGDAPNEMLDRLNAEFEASHPGVTVERVTKAFEDLTVTVPLAMTDPNPPDILPVNYGWTQMGDFVQTGGLLGLNDYADQYGWRDRLPAGLVGMQSFSEDGTQFGGDQLYSMAYSGQWVGVYYNKSKLEALGLAVPSTFDEFLAAVDEAGTAGELPIQAGVLEQWPAGHVWMTFQNAISDPTNVRDFIFGGGDSFVTDSNLEAATTIAELGSSGAFGENFAGVSVDDAVAQFAQGNGVFFIQGTWFSKTLSDAMGDNVGVFPMPRLDGGPAAATASPGYGYSITAQSEHHDLAAEYLDFITGPRSAEILLELGSLPVLPADGIEVDNALLADILAGWTTLAENDTMLPFLDWAAPPLLADLGAASQELMAGRTSPEDFLARVDSDYQDFIAES